MDVQCFFEEYMESEKVNIMALQSGKVQNRILPIGSIKRAAGGEYDTYMSMNPLMRKEHCIKRDKEHVARLKWLYVDLDYYNSAYKNFSKKQIVGLLEMDYFNKSIPAPTYVIDSGRGIYLLWRIDENVKAYSRWTKMQQFLCNHLSEFGADWKVATDSARVLRKPGSINSKSGTQVSIIQHEARKYSLTSLLREYVIGEEPSPQMTKYAKAIASDLGIPLPDMRNREAVKKFIRDNKEPANLFRQYQSGQKRCEKSRKSNIKYIRNTYTMTSARLQDLEQLIRMRDQENGYREHILFLYRYWQLCITDSPETSLQRTLDLNNSLQNPLSEKEVITATKSAEKYFYNGKSLRCSNTYVIQALNITEDEMKHLNFFIGECEKKKRKQARNSRAYLASLKLAGKLTKQSQIMKRRKQVEALLRKGLAGEDICEKLQISRATFYSDKKAVESYLTAKKQKIEALAARFQEWKKHREECCLKNSAFVLNMSFRTSVPSVLGGLHVSSTYFIHRFCTFLGTSILRSLSWRSWDDWPKIFLC